MRTMLLLALLLVPMASANLEIDFGDDCWDCDEPIDYEMVMYTLLIVLFFVLMVVVIAAAASN